MSESVAGKGQSVGAASAVSPDPIVSVATGFMAAKQLFAASEIGLFAALADGALDAAGLAARTGVPEKSVRIVADAMAGLGLLERDGDRYVNSAAAGAYLAGADGLDLRPHMAFWNAISYPHWQTYSDTVRKYAPSPLNLEGARMADFMTGVQAYNTAHALMLADHYDFGAHRKVLDLAGLSPAFLAAAIDHNPALTGTFFAAPQMIEFARGGLDATQANKIELVGADPMADPLPRGHDGVLLEHVIHRYDADDNQKLLTRAREVVDPGAKLLILDFMLDEGEPRRAIDSLLAGEYLVIDGTVVYPEKEVRAWLDATGWKWLETRLLPGSPRVLIAEAV